MALKITAYPIRPGTQSGTEGQADVAVGTSANTVTSASYVDTFMHMGG